MCCEWSGGVGVGREWWRDCVGGLRVGEGCQVAQVGQVVRVGWCEWLD